MSEKEKHGQGCFVQLTTGFILIFLALILALGVGLIVHFVEKDNLQTSNNGGAKETASLSSPEKLTQQCKNMVEGDKNKEICKACPASSPCPNIATTTSSSKSSRTTPSPRPLQNEDYTRLPKSLRPLTYDLEIQPNLYGNDPTSFTFSGKVKIKISCLEATKNVTLHAKNLTIDQNLVKFEPEVPGDPSYGKASFVSMETDKEREFQIFKLSEDLVKGKNYIYLATTQFQPTDARKAFPCFDEPAMKAKFTISVVRKKGWQSLSNLDKISTAPRGVDMEVDNFKESPEMSTYLVAFVVSQFQSLTDQTSRGLKYSAWAQPASVNQTLEALHVGVKVIDFYEKFFGIDFPLPKQDMIAIPDYPLGAMENWGLITYRETAMLYDPLVSTEYNKQRVTIVIAHEVSHQWFGNLVTMEWWGDLWLNEGFATFIEYFGSSIVHPDWQMMEQFTVGEIYDAFSIDGLATSHPIYLPVNSPDEINEIFDAISYNKGGSVVRMIRFFMGEDTFLKGIQDYLNARKYKNAFHDDLWSALQLVATKERKTYPASIKNIMDTWISQMNYPVVMVTQPRTGVLHLEQKRFLIDDSNVGTEKFKSPYNYTWTIPFTYTTNEDGDFNKTDKDVKWLTAQSNEISDNFLPNPNNEDSWILGNVQQYGFYRVNYPRQNWLRLIKQLKTDNSKISPINRGQIINDAWNLARAGQVDMDVALQTTEYLDKEMSYVPWRAAERELGYLSTMISRTEIYGEFQKFMQSKVDPPFKKLTLDDSNSTHIETLLRTQIASTACGYGVAGCVSQATKLFSEWMENPDNNKIDPDIKSTVYCTGVSEGGEAEWNFALEQFKKTEVVSEKSLLMGALSCTKIEWLLSRYLTLSLDESVIRRQDTVSVIIDVSKNSIGRYLAWNFVTENWDFLRNSFGKGFFSFSNLVKGITEAFNTQSELEQLEQFINTHPDLGTGERAFQQAAENTRSNIKWMEKNYATVKTWLQTIMSGKRKEKKNVRLPLSVIPELYQIEIQPDIYGPNPEEFKFYGKVKIDVQCNNATTNITLHIHKLTVDQTTITVKAMSGNTGVEFYDHYGEDKDRQFMIVFLKRPLVAGQKYTLEMKYQGNLEDDLAGVYLSSYERDGKPVYMATTQMEATDARKTFPCFDEPALKAKFKLTILRKPTKISLSNMPKERTNVKRDNGYVADVYQTSEKMSTYLVCFVVCDFKGIYGKTKHNITYGAWARPESIDQAKLALETGIETITFYEDFFGIKFPLEKQDMIAIPDFSAGAMENWGLITYRETAMLYQPGVSTASNKQRVTVVITHELAHQWFGDLVTMDWWDDLWLNEGFATFVQYLGADHKYPEWKMFDQFTINEVQDAFDFDGLVTSHPIYAPVADPAEINEIFDTISYSKGASIIRMMRWFLGEETFKNGLKKYLDSRKFKNAVHNDLWNAMTQQSGIDGGGRVADVKSVMDTWTLQMNYPVIHVTMTSPTQITVSQKRFVQDPTAKDPLKYTSPYGYKWDIPFTFTTGSDKNFNQTWRNIIWVKQRSQVISLGQPIKMSDWILANIQQYGYYRVNYDRENWLKLVSQLKSKHQDISAVNRGQMINDAWSIAKSGDLDMDIALKVLEYLGSELDYVPWYAARHQLSYVRRMVSRTPLYGKLQKYVKKLVQGPFKHYGMDNTGAGHLEIYIRSLLVGEACDYGIEECAQGALKMYRDWMTDPENNRVDPDLKSTVYCTGIAEGGEKEWDFAFQQFKASGVAAEKNTLMSAMGCSKQTWILSRYLDMVIKAEDIRRQDGSRVMGAIAASPLGRDLAWNFLRQNFQTFLNMYGATPFGMKNLLNGVTASFGTELDLQQLKDLQRQYPDMGTGTRAFQQIIEKTELNVRWLKENNAIIESWLDENLKSDVKELRDVRLPKNVAPFLYDLEIFPDIYQSDPADFTFKGYIKIWFRTLESTSNITLHKHLLDIDANTVSVGTNQSVTPPSVRSTSEDKDRQFFIIHLDNSLVDDTMYFVVMNYSGILRNDLAGLYYSSYKRGDDTVYMATTQMEATDARKTFPCFDEPALKAKFKVTILRKPTKISLSNMPKERTGVPRENGYVADVYQTSEKMSTYLVCLIVCDFNGIHGKTKHNITYGAWARPESIDQAKLALETGIETITFYEDFFGIKFPPEKQDMIAIPDFSAGAMENWGLITYRETAMLYQPGVSSASNKQRVTVVITHELAHQWFGDLVTMDWWDDLWLNEGFATFVEYLGADHKYPDWKMFEQFTVNEVQDAFDFDGLVTSHPIYAPVADPARINEIFDTISYSKGASIIRMMRWFLGEDTFQNGLKKYLDNRKFRNAVHDDLWNAMTNQSRLDAGGRVADVKSVMDTWTLQMNYPVINVTMTSPTQITVSQKRFVQDPTAKDPLKYTSPFGWDIPFTFTTGSDKNFNQTWKDINWVKQRSQVITLGQPIKSTDWILANIQQYGYYRVNYDRENWLKLVSQLKSKHQDISAVNRGQMINDAWSIAKSGDLDMDIALKVLEYLGSELDYVPWYAARHQLSYVKRMVSRTPLYGKLQKYVQKLVQGPFKHYGMDNSGAGHIEIYIRSLLVGEACDYGIKECTQGALKMYRDWMLDPKNNRVDPDLKSTVYCTGIAEGGEKEWDFAFQQFKASGVAAEKNTLMSAMGCSKQTWILSRYLDMVIKAEDIRRQDGSRVMGAIAASPLGRDLAWNFLRQNFQTFLDMYGATPFGMKNLLNGVTASFGTELDLQQLKDLQRQYPDMGTGTRAFQQIIEKTELNVRWLKENNAIIESWLDENLKSDVKELRDVRLPKNVAPFLYDLEIFPDIYQSDPADFTFKGYVKIWFRTLERTSNITLHKHLLDIDVNTVAVSTNQSVTPPSVRSTSEDKDRQFFIIHLDNSLADNTMYFVVMNYSGILRNDLAGLYYSSYKRGDDTVYMATTQMEATDARKTFPCFDEPALKAKFKVTILRKPTKISLSNMPKERTGVPRGNGYVADVYQTSEKMSTYLVCLIVCDFKSIHGKTKHNITYGAWARPESTDQAKLALETGIETITFYEDFFGIKFPLEKQDMIAIPDFSAGAMENWGLITYRETAMLYQPGVSSASNKQRVTKVITHELAHQWFGNLVTIDYFHFCFQWFGDLVTMDWWDDLWLNEGFARFVEYLGADHKYPDWKMFEQFTVHEVQSAFDFDGLVTSHPIYAPVADPARINEIFDTISYSKGASIIRMMRWFLGEDTFQNGLKKYLDNRKFKNAKHDDLWNAMAEQSQKDGEGRVADVKSVMDTWTLQMNYPVLNVTMTSPTQITVSQKRFVQDPTAKDPLKYTSPFGYRWDIPFTFTTGSDKNFNQTWKDINWVKEKSQVISLGQPMKSTDWILANLQQYGYYRVNYDRENWLKLVSQLKSKHQDISAVNRGQMINDAWSIAKSGDLDMDIALKVLEYLGNELDYVPWYAARHQLSYVKRMVSRTPLYGKLQKYVQKLVKGPFKHYGMDNTGAGHIEIYTRSLLVGEACDYGITECAEGALKMYRDWMTDPKNNRVDPDLKSTVYCTGIAEGGEKEWDFAFQQFKASGVAAEKNTLMSAMGCSKQTWILSRYLDMVIKAEDIRRQDGSRVMGAIAASPLGRDLAWNFLRQNFQTFLDMYGASPFSMKNLLNGVTASFGTELDLQQLKDLQRQYPDMGTGTRAFQQIIEKTELNVRWLKENNAIIESWLDENLKSDVKELRDVRLPKNVAPFLYDLEIFPDIYQSDPADFTFKGYIKIWFRTLERTSNITLHKHLLDIDVNTVAIDTNQSVTPPSVRSTSEDKDRQFFIIQLDNLLADNTVYFVVMNYSGILRNDLAGLYYSSYKRGDDTVYMATTQMEATDARKTFPCFDEPALKAKFKVTILRKPTKISLSNMPKERTGVPRGNGYVADVYQTSEKMSTYLVCLIVCDFKGIHGKTKHNITYGAWARPESTDQAKLALETGIETITFYEDFFGIKFPLEKQDMIAIPDFSAGAMENWGLITYRETAMLYQPGVSSASNKQRVTVVITHELAHQWFGDLVTMDWWDDLWLNEGFATFVEYLGADHKYPDWKMFEQFTVNEVQDAFDFDGLVTSHPIYAPVADPARINEIFDTISYSKGASIIRMMRWFLGEDTFQNGLKKYLDNRKFRNAVHDDLWNAMTNQSRLDAGGRVADVKSVMDTWTLQMNYPVINVTMTSPTQITVSQKRFVQDPTAKDPLKYTSPFGWDIPFTFTTGSDKNFNQTWKDINWVKQRSQVITLGQPIKSTDWILANIQQYGYYRVNYDRENWLKLVSQLKSKHQDISAVNRGQMINDAWSIAKSGDLDMDIALKVLEYLGSELDYVPWYAARHQLSYVNRMVSRTPLYGKLQKYVQKLVQGPFEHYGMDNSGAGHIEIYIRSLLVGEACDYGIKECTQGALKMYRDWMLDPKNNRVDPDLKSTVYCTGIAEGGEKEWDFAFQQFKASGVAAEKNTLMSAMGCSKQTWILSRYLDMVIKAEDIRRQDGSRVMGAIAASPLGRDLAWNFLRQNFQTFLDMYGASPFGMKNLLNGVTASFGTELDLQQLKELQRQYPDMGTGTRAFQQIIEKTELNVRWLKENNAIIESWLDENLKSGVTEVSDVRIPKNVAPFLYDLEIFPDIYQSDPADFMFKGYVKIWFRTLESTSNITLHQHLLDIDINTITVGSNETAVPPGVVRSTSEDKDRQFFIIQLENLLADDTVYFVAMNYSGILRDDLTGLYYSSYKRGDETVYMATTQMEPTDARKTLPCFDEPALKAKFKVTLVRRNDRISLSNMPKEASVDRGNNLIADIYQTSETMSTYLLCLIVCDFKENNDTTRTGTMWFGNLVTMDWWDDLWLNEGFATFVQYLGADHKFPEWRMFEQFTISEVQEAFDFDGLVTSHPIYAPVENPDQINEIFDSISYAKGGSIIRMMRNFVGEEIFRQGVTNYLNERRYKNAYHDDLWFAIGNESLARGNNLDVKGIMDTWILQMNYPVVTVTKQSDGKLKLSQKRFLIDYDATDPMKYISPYNYQWRIPFTYTTSTAQNFNQTSTDVIWFDDKEKDDEWVVANVEQMGYYRVNYDADNWALLTKQLNTNHTESYFSKVVNVRKALVQQLKETITQFAHGQGNPDRVSGLCVDYDEACRVIDRSKSHARGMDFLVIHLTISGDLAMEIALNTVSYLKFELDYVPWSAASSQLAYVRTMLERTDIYGKYKMFMQNLIQNPFTKLGLDNKDATHIEKFTRSLVAGIACNYDIEGCMSESVRLYKQWMDNPDTGRVDPDLKSTVYCTGIAEGNEEEWDFAYAQYKTTDVAAEKNTLLHALACTQETWLLTRYLNLALDENEVRKQDAVSVIVYVSRNVIGRDLVWNFLNENWEKLRRDYGGGSFSFSNLFDGIFESFNTEIDLEKLQEFLQANPDLGSGQRAFQQAIEKTESNIKWMKNNYPIVKEWLDNNTMSNPKTRQQNLRLQTQQQVLRLPRSVFPELYDLELFPDIYHASPKDFKFYGNETIIVNCTEATNDITLHIRRLTIFKSEIEVKEYDGKSKGDNLYLSMTTDEDNEFLILNLKWKLQPGHQYSVYIKFEGNLTDDLAGLYYSSYKRGNDTIYLATTQFESADARKAFPCFDEPDFKAKFKVTLLRKDTMKSLSNMPIMKTESRPGSLMADYYTETPRMSTYLTAFVICDYEKNSTTTKNNITYNVWAPKESLSQASLALEIGTKIITFFEEYFGVAFPLPKQDMVAIPDFPFGAQENWGLVTYREDAMLFQPGVSSEENKQRIAVVVVHEMAHMWFGDLVTMKWWDELWLNEGFATFSETFGTEHLYPDWKMFEQYVNFKLYDVFNIDSSVNSHPIYVPIDNIYMLNTVFDGISYGKGGCLIRMMRFFLGDDTFRNGAKQIKIDKTNLPVSVKEIMNTWILQMNYPLLTVTAPSSGKIRVRQQRFLSNPDAKDPGRYVSPYGYKWWVPFTYTTSTMPNFDQTNAEIHWLNDSSMEVNDASIPTGVDSWIVANVQQYGVYRVNYTEQNWRALIKQLNTNHTVISSINRAQIINDAWSLARSNQLSMDIALQTVNYLAKERGYLPRITGEGELGYIDSMLGVTKHYGKYKKLRQDLIKPIYKELGFNNTGASHIESYIRSHVASTACDYEVEECVEEAKRQYKMWMTNPSNFYIDPNMKYTVYCTGIREGGQTEWEFAYNQYKTSPVASERSNLT
ncbi:hypothetical protein FSP39_018341 [Pinctada imbricata]|uniref:Aminopeptidase N n=1 Tax=Pinctada imbricata TaxID=66713 RepID=A0AA88YXJ6_PINIB|nr:hypothetical protein FSP39_018341 [Pinctada imbricata]